MSTSTPVVVIAAEAGAVGTAIRRALESGGFQLVEAASTDEVLAEAGEHCRLIVLDPAFAAVDANEIHRRLTSHPATAKIPVLYLADIDAGAASADPAVSPQQANTNAPWVEREAEELARLSRFSPAMEVTADAFGMRTLRTHAPTLFQQLVERYARVLELGLEQSGFVVDNHLSDELRNFGDELGRLGAGPRDVLEVHNEALRDKRDGKNAHRAHAYLQEGRLLVLELMGHLVSYYRRHAVGIRRRGSGPAAAEEHHA